MVLTLHSKRRTLMFRPCFLRLLRPLLPDMTWEMADRSSVYLTFDDGPTPGITEWILKTLAGYGVRATFFCLGKNVEQHPDLYRAIADAGHKVRNTEYALPRAIEYIAEAGFRFGTIGAAAEPVGPAAKGLHRPDGHRIEAEHPPLVGAGGLSGRY